MKVKFLIYCCKRLRIKQLLFKLMIFLFLILISCGNSKKIVLDEPYNKKAFIRKVQLTNGDEVIFNGNFGKIDSANEIVTGLSIDNEKIQLKLESIDNYENYLDIINNSKVKSINFYSGSRFICSDKKQKYDSNKDTLYCHGTLVFNEKKNDDEFLNDMDDYYNFHIKEISSIGLEVWKISVFNSLLVLLLVSIAVFLIFIIVLLDEWGKILRKI